MPLLTAASGSLALPGDNARETLAQSSSFQTWIRVDASLTATQKQAAANNRIFDDGLPAPASGGTYTREEIEQLFPCAILSLETYRAEYDGASGYEDTGTIAIQFVDIVPAALAALSPGEIGRRLLNHVGDVIENLKSLAESNTNLIADSIEMLRPWQMGEHDDVETTHVVVDAEIVVAWRGT